MSKPNTRAIIDANIRQNGRQLITGQVLNAVLNSMVTDYAEQAALDALKEKVDALALGAFYGYFPDSDSLPTDVTTPGYAYVGSDNPYEIWNFNGESWSDSGTSIDMNDADEEDITRNADGKLQFKDRSYGDGMGYVILRKDKTFAGQVSQANTIYEIRYDFDLNGVTSFGMPNNCILKFNGGKLTNGTIVGHKTSVSASEVEIFGSNLTLTGEWTNDCFYPEWFGAKGDGTNNDAPAIQKAINVARCVKLGINTYKITETLMVKANTTIVGCGFGTQISNVGCDAISSDGSVVGVLLADFRILGDRTEGQCGIKFSSPMPKMVMRNLHVSGCGDWGIWLDDSWDYAIDNVNVSTNKNGLYAYEFNSSSLTKVVAWENEELGIVIANSANARITGTIQENGYTGLLMQGCFGCSVSVYGEQNGFAAIGVPGATNEMKSEIVLSAGTYHNETCVCNDVTFYLLGGKTSEMPSTYGVYLNWASRNVLRGFAIHHITNDVYETGNSNNNIVETLLSNSTDRLTSDNIYLLEYLKSLRSDIGTLRTDLTNLPNSLVKGVFKDFSHAINFVEVGDTATSPVTFAREFDAVPNILMTPLNTAKKVMFSVVSRSKTGFTFQCHDMEGNPVTDVFFSYLAIGQRNQ